MRTLLSFVALLVLGACDSAKPEQASTTAESSNSKPLTATYPGSTSSSNESSIATDIPEVQPNSGNTGSGSVEYYNPGTGTTASYDLEVEYDSDGDVEQINFPSGGYIGSHHITEQTHNGDGTITVTTDRGQEFTVDEDEGNDAESSEE